MLNYRGLYSFVRFTKKEIFYLKPKMLTSVFCSLYRCLINCKVEQCKTIVIVSIHMWINVGGNVVFYKGGSDVSHLSH